MAGSENMQNLISLIDRLQEAVSSAGMSPGDFNFPQIAVVGSQSAGKSSVLENFIGRDFLPRGDGIVTRCPLVLKLHPCDKEYAKFDHMTQLIYEFDNVRREIIERTQHLAGSGQQLSDIPIHLHIYSPHVVKLNLIDLPGLIRVPIGEQPPDIEDKIKAMIVKYISNKNTLILAVTPANQDLASSDALTLAKVVDPQKERTIGVVTKIDLMDKGTDARKFLENKIYHLQRGYVGIVNRSQEDISNNVDIKTAQAKEAEYFHKHPIYQHMAARMGTKYLQNLLNKQLIDHIHQQLPEIHSEMNKRYSFLRAEMEKLNAFDESAEWKYETLIRFLQDFGEFLRRQLEGHSIEVTGDTLTAGAKINRYFYKDMHESLKEVSKKISVNRSKLEIKVKNLHGFRSEIFTPGLAFDNLIKELIKEYQDPVLRSVEDISNIIKRAISEYCSKEFTQYPKFKEKLTYILNKKMQEQIDDAKKHLLYHIEAECAFMNVNHPQFLFNNDSYLSRANATAEKSKTVLQTAGTISVVKNKFLEWVHRVMPSAGWALYISSFFSNNRENDSYVRETETVCNTSKKEDGVELIVKMTNCYMPIVQTNIFDLLPKCLVHFLINGILQFSQGPLIAEMTRGKDWNDFMEESADTLEIKKTLRQNYNAVSKSLEILNSFEYGEFRD